MKVARLIPSMLIKTEEKRTSTPRQSESVQKNTARTACNFPKPAAAHCQNTTASPVKPVTTSAAPSSSPCSSLTRFNQDRKSTRLNSSHGYISYAVFCLKKKKKKTNQ